MVPKKSHHHQKNNHLEQRMEELVQIYTQTNQNIENLQQTISSTNDEL